MKKGILHGIGVIFIMAFSTCIMSLCVGFIYGLPIWGLSALLNYFAPSVPALGYGASVIVAAIITLVKIMPKMTLNDLLGEKK